MLGSEEFLKIFGGMSVISFVELILAGIFLYFVYKKVSDYLVARYEAQKIKDEQLAEALESVRKYPTYRQQSIKIQERLEDEIRKLRESQEALREDQQCNLKRLAKMEDDMRRRECNRLRDLILQNYRYYTSKETNPEGTWTCLEAETFWELFKEYEDNGGNGFVHEVVQPAMSMLRVVDHH